MAFRMKEKNWRAFSKTIFAAAGWKRLGKIEGGK